MLERGRFCLHDDSLTPTLFLRSAGIRLKELLGPHWPQHISSFLVAMTTTDVRHVPLIKDTEHRDWFLEFSFIKVTVFILFLLLTLYVWNKDLVYLWQAEQKPDLMGTVNRD